MLLHPASAPYLSPKITPTQQPQQELSVPLTRWLKSFPAMSSLHPFESALLDLTVGAATYASVLGKVDTLRKALQEVCVCVCGGSSSTVCIVSASCVHCV